MALQLLPQGRDYFKSFERTVDGVVTPHADIAEVEVYLYVGEEQVLKFSKTDREGEGFLRLSKEAEEGNYTLKAPSESTSTWVPEKILTGEFVFELATGDKCIFIEELAKIQKTHHL